MICYHTTDAAEQILRGGFRDATGSYGYVNRELTGVWLGDRPMDINEGAEGDQVLRVEFPHGVDLDEFEVIEDGKPYREWCVPAALINEHATLALMSDDELERMGATIWRGYLEAATVVERWQAASVAIKGKVIVELMDVVVIPARRGSRTFRTRP